MDIRQLRYVIAIARTKHFTHAAEQLGVAQPALSQAVAQLEKQIGVSLFERSSRRVQLTSAGRLFVDRAESILAQLDALEDNMREHAKLLLGQVNIGTMVFFFFGKTRLAEVVAEFSHLYPGVELILDNHTVDQNLESLRLGEIDVALLNIVENASCPGLDIIVLGHDDIAAALPPDHRFAGRDQITFSELRNERFVLYKPGSTMHDVMTTLVRDAGFNPRAAVQSQNIVLVRSLISAGVGVSIGPRSYLMSPGPPVAVVPLQPLYRIAIAMVTHPQRASNPAARVFIDFMRERFVMAPPGNP